MRFIHLQLFLFVIIFYRSLYSVHTVPFVKVNQFAIFIWFCIEFPERVNETDPVEPVPCQPWSSRASKMTQPNLDYMGMYIVRFY